MAQQLIFDTRIFEGFQICNLPNAEHGEATHDILTKAQATPAIVENMPGPLQVFAAKVQKETEATYKDLTDPITKEINEILARKSRSRNSR